MDTVVTGAAFGASLVASFMYQPHLIAAQFTLQQWNMVQTFLSATGSSALAIELFRQLGYTVAPPRSWSSTGLSNSAIDGNILGGLLLGTGMALSSSCPGMALPQLALGIPTAPAILAGACAGGVVWSALLRPWLAAAKRHASTTTRSRATVVAGVQQQQQQQQQPPSTSFPQALGLGRTTTLVLCEAVLALAVYVVAARAPTAWSPIHPVAGGLLIGGAQVVSLLLRRGALLGTSTCFEQLGDWVVYMARQGSGRGSGTGSEGGRKEAGGGGGVRPGTSAMLFAAAMVGGAWALASRRPDFAPTIVHSGGGPVASTGRALAGGFLMAVGSRLAGGCTSGHGISGLALMSMSSLVTMMAAFGAAIGVRKYMI